MATQWKRLIFFVVLVICFSGALWADPLELQIRQQVVTISAAGGADKIPATPLRGREFLMIKNIDAVTIYIGSSTVTADEAATGGDQLLPSERVYLEYTSDVDIYGAVAAGTAKVAILEGK